MAMPTDLFKALRIPKHLVNSQLAAESHWFTWSPTAKRVLRALARVVESFEAPRIVHLQRKRGYDYTYSLDHTHLAGSSVGRDIVALATDLTQLTAPDGVLFFAGLLDNEIDGRTLSAGRLNAAREGQN